MLKDNNYLDISLEMIEKHIENIDLNSIESAAEMIMSARDKGNRLHFTGIGKPSYVAAYSASLFSSVGIPSYFLDGTEAIHGSSGQILPGDIVICISNSGETEELLKALTAIRNNGGKIISVTSNPDSTLAQSSDINLATKTEQEGGPLNRAPRASILAQMLTLQTLSVVLQNEINLSVEDYLQRHPGGTLGKRG